MTRREVPTAYVMEIDETVNVVVIEKKSSPRFKIICDTFLPRGSEVL